MLARIRVVAGAILLVTLAVTGHADAAATAADAGSPPARLHLATAHMELAPQQAGRYSLRARFQREERAGELREGGDFVLLGRFAKAGVGCDANTVFRSGFEG